jgi:glycosyltransferase involved in cell wall biosynthesis
MAGVFVFTRAKNVPSSAKLVARADSVKTIIRLIPFLFFKLRLFAIWRLAPRAIRQRLVGRIVPQLPTRRHILERPKGPVIVVGPLRSTTSFGWIARLTTEVARCVGLRVYTFDIANAFGAEHLTGSDKVVSIPPARVIEGEATLLLFLNPHQLRYVAAFLPSTIFENKYVIGYCAWELERIPDQWLGPIAMLDEIWVPSEFVRQAFVGSGVAQRCRVVPPLFGEPPPISSDRKRFGIRQNVFAVLVAFSLRSGVVRKNPLASVRAFLNAFPSDSDVQLVFKISDVDIESSAWTAFRQAVGDDPRFVFITRLLPDLEVWSLLASVDVVLSTHRAEGYGMVSAQAMLSGRVVVATGWSGNLDFMPSDGAMLMPYTLVPVKDVEGIYVVEGTKWAEIDEQETSTTLRRLYSDPVLRSRLALSGKDHVQSYFRLRRQELTELMRTWHEEGLSHQPAPYGGGETRRGLACNSSAIKKPV